MKTSNLTTQLREQSTESNSSGQNFGSAVKPLFDLAYFCSALLYPCRGDYSGHSGIVQKTLYFTTKTKVKKNHSAHSQLAISTGDTQINYVRKVVHSPTGNAN